MTPRERHLKKKYGLTPAQYEELLEVNDGGCWICGWKPKDGQRALAVDHDHRSGKIRGILCNHRCNRFLMPWMDLYWLEGALLYLARGTPYTVPKKQRKKVKRG